jgi:predicted amino acid dehydrogenase
LGYFGFLVHPLGLEDVIKKYKLAEKLSPRLVASVLRRRPPFVLSEVSGIKTEEGKEAKGVLVAVPLLPNQFLELPEEKVLKKIAKACRLAAKEGAKIVGLGAFTAIPGEGGRKLLDYVNVPITTGNTYTTATAIEGTLKACELMELETKKSTLAVVGATGSIGFACSVFLSSHFREVILIGRDEKKLKNVFEKVGEKNENIKFHTDLGEIKRAEVIVSATSAFAPLIEPSLLKSGAIVCDVARPRDVSRRVISEREDVLVIDGGIVKVPGSPRWGFDLGLPNNLAFGCLAETIILALEERYENYTIGKEISLEKIEEIWNLARKHGFKLSALRSFEQTIPPEKIEKIKEKVEKKAIM